MSAGRLGLVVGLIGLLVTGLLAWTARSLNHSNERRLLQVQTEQAGALIASSILGIEAPLATALQIETVTSGDVGQFTRFMAPHRTRKLFVFGICVADRQFGHADGHVDRSGRRSSTRSQHRLLSRSRSVAQHL